MIPDLEGDPVKAVLIAGLLLSLTIVCSSRMVVLAEQRLGLDTFQLAVLLSAALTAVVCLM